MSKYVDADALVEEIQRCSYETWSKDINRAWWAQAVKVKDNIVHCIERQPTADVVEAKHGYWKWEEHQLHCSCCHEECLVGEGNYYIKSEYCPNCGAKMGGERSENGKP